MAQVLVRAAKPEEAATPTPGSGAGLRPVCAGDTEHFIAFTTGTDLIQYMRVDLDPVS